MASSLRFARKTALLMNAILLSVVLLLAAHAVAQEEKPTEPAARPSEAAKPAKPKLSQEELEARFKTTLTKATMAGRWCSIKDGKLGPDKEDKYTILGVSKVGGEVWLIHARIQYGNKDITAPIPVQVKWAGDTPVIVVDDVGVPGSGKYSARVLIYNNTYAGTWSGGDHGGLMSGVITQAGE